MAILFVALFNSILGLSILFPILAPLGRQLGLVEVQIGSLSTAYALMQLIVSPIWGRRSERVGRKPVLLTGVIGFGISFLLFALVAELGYRGVLRGAPLYAGLLVSRAIGGTFSSATLPTAQAYVADTTGRGDRTAGMAVIGAAFGLGIIFGPLIGALLSMVSLLAPIYLSAALALLNAAFIALRLKEPERRLSVKPPELGPVAIKVWPLLGVALAVSLASVAMEQTIAFTFQDKLGLSLRDTPRVVGAALGVYGFVAVLAQGVIVRRFRWPPLRLLGGGLPCALAGFVGLIFAHRFGALTAALAAQGFGQGLAMPGVTAAVSLGASEDEQGAVAGLNSSSQALGRLMGPVVGTGLYQINPEYPYGFSALLLALVLVLLLTSRRLRVAISAGA
ncbi:MAG TPA: MFS transporter [Polyangiaceae bacterium]|nr:MFS transporter [Polyangiaceae bacterium]